MRKKGDLPQRTCLACGRPFAWRKKWARDWENVKFCSERCRRAKTSDGPGRDPHDEKAADAVWTR